MKRLQDLGDELQNAQPIGRPKLIKLSGSDAGIDYIFSLETVDGIANKDRDKLDYAFLYPIEKNAPEEADAFSRSDILNLNNNHFLHVGRAVQYYKINKK